MKHAGHPIIVEIGTDWLKMIQAEPSRGGVSISRLHVEPIQPGAVDLAGSIARAFKEKKFTKAPVIACVPRQMATIRLLDLPSTDVSEIADMVDLQVTKQTPYSKDEIVFDSKVLGPGREGYSKVMLVIVQRGILRQRFHLLEEAGIEVGQMSVSSEGILSWYRHALAGRAGTGNRAALLDIDSFYSDLVIMTGTRLEFTRSILIGANQLLADFDAWKDKLAREVKQAFDTFQSEAQGTAPVKLFVSGAAVRMGDIAGALGPLLGLPVEPADALKSATRLPASPNLADAPYRPVSLTPLVGMALAPEQVEFNMVPDSVTVRKGLVSKARNLTALGMLVMTLLVSASLFASFKLFFKDDSLKSLQRELDKARPEVESVNKMMEINVLVRNNSDLRFTAVNLWLEVQGLRPGGVLFDAVGFDLDKEQDQVVLGGVGTMEEIRAFKDSLEKSALFKDVKDTTRRGEGDAFKFQIECSLEKAP